MLVRQIYFLTNSKSVFLCFKNRKKQMETAKILEILGYTLPSLVTGGVAYFLFEGYFKDQQNTRRWLLQKENKKDLLPLRLQAYERLTLLMERIHPAQILLRNSPVTNDKKEYENFIIDQIQQEFEHNLSQQIYVSGECWSIIQTAKNATIQMIRIAAQNEKVQTASDLREFVVSSLVDKASPTYAALDFIKQEVGQLW
jgi:16S rRNA C1402 (ribose-2'-O) methylase RsmI